MTSKRRHLWSPLMFAVYSRFLHPRINLYHSRRWRCLILCRPRTVRRHPGPVATASGVFWNHFRSRHVGVHDGWVFTGRSPIIAVRSAAMLSVDRSISGSKPVAVNGACVVVDLHISTSGHVVDIASNVGHIVFCSCSVATGIRYIQRQNTAEFCNIIRHLLLLSSS